MLITQNLSCVRAGNIIFENMGFCLQPGALLLLKGPNGSGKTTLLKILAGLLPIKILAGLLPADSGDI
jgi:heme exporter protein A